jgi:hydroxyacylglutathione hydrolase
MNQKNLNMKVEQIYTSCLAHGAYYIESNGEAAVIDPLRDPDTYLQMAASSGAKIKYILETHFHADFVSGHLDLAKETGATVVFGPTAKPNFNAHVAADGEILKLGNMKIKVLHTPGHTMESSCFLLMDENDKPLSCFTGDTLFIGDVGRPDLAVKTDLSREDLAGHLFDSLRNKIMTLPDDVLVYPGHGKGSACGKNLGDDPYDTIGNQKKVNYALRYTMSKEEFVKEVTDGLLPPPVYFPKNAVMNREGYTLFSDVKEKALRAYDPDEFEMLMMKEKALVIDTRNTADFAKAHIPGSWNIGIDGQFAMWVGALVHDIKQRILIVAEPGREQEVVTRLSRVGYDDTIGFLSGGFATWTYEGKAFASTPSLSPDDFATLYKKGNVTLIDVRKPGEYLADHFDNVPNIPLDYLIENMDKFPKEGTFYLHCAGGYRSMIAASILQSNGYTNVVNVEGGYKKIAEALGLVGA